MTWAFLNARAFLSFDVHGVVDIDFRIAAEAISRISSHNDTEVIIGSYSVNEETRLWTQAQLGTTVGHLDLSGIAAPRPQLNCLFTRTKYLPLGKPNFLKLRRSGRSVHRIDDDDDKIVRQLNSLGTGIGGSRFNPSGRLNLLEFLAELFASASPHRCKVRKVSRSIQESTKQSCRLHQFWIKRIHPNSKLALPQPRRRPRPVVYLGDSMVPSSRARKSCESLQESPTNCMFIVDYTIQGRLPLDPSTG